MPHLREGRLAYWQPDASKSKLQPFRSALTGSCNAKWYRVIGDKSSVIAIAALALSTPFNSTSPAGPITAKLYKLILSGSLSTGELPFCPQVEGGIQYLEDKL